MDMLFASEALPFSVALGLMLLIALLEIVSLFAGGGISGFFDSFLPDSLDVDSMAGVEGIQPGPVTATIGWLQFGKLPFLIVTILFLTFFGISGLLVQKLATFLAGEPLSPAIAIIPALLLTFPGMRFGGAALARILPGDESEASSKDSFIGKTGVITLGGGRIGEPGEARVRDDHGLSHYLRVIPDSGDVVLDQGAIVLIVDVDGPVYIACLAPDSLQP